MKVSEITIKGTIPTGQYANLQPEITISEIDSIQEATQHGLDWMKEHFERFSEKGALTDKDIQITDQKKSLLTKV